MKNLPLFSLLLVSVISFAQVGIGTITPNSSAAFDVTSTTKGLLPPRMTTVQRDAIVSPTTGLQVYNTTTNTNDYYNGTAWISGSAGAQVTAATDPTFANNSTSSISSNWIKGYAQTLATSPVSFRAYQNATTALSNGSHTKVIFQVDDFDATNAYDATTGRWNPKVAGNYQINWTISYNQGSPARTFSDLRKNNVAIGRSTDINSANLLSMGGSSLVYMNGTTDYLEVWCYSGGANLSTDGTISTQFSAFLTNSPAQFAQAVVTAATDPTFTNASNQAVSADWVRGVTTPTYGSAVLDTGTNVNLPPLADASTAVNVLNFTLPSAGTWDVTVQMRAAITSSTQNVFWCLCVYDNNNTLVPNSETFFNSTPATVGIGLNSTGQTRVIVTTTGAASYSLRGYQPGGTANIYATSDGVGRTKATWVKIQ